MKIATLLLSTTLLGIGQAQAQGFTNTGYGVNTVSLADEAETTEPAKPAPAAKIVYITPQSMEPVTMNDDGGSISFQNLPRIAMTMHVTDERGNEIMRHSVSAKHNIVQLKKLGKGMHFVTLVSNNTDNRKGFTLNRN
jgi:hypothetical protein